MEDKIRVSVSTSFFEVIKILQSRFSVLFFAIPYRRAPRTARSLRDSSCGTDNTFVSTPDQRADIILVPEAVSLNQDVSFFSYNSYFGYSWEKDD